MVLATSKLWSIAVDGEFQHKRRAKSYALLALLLVLVVVLFFVSIVRVRV
ncbi:hypothetical protein [Anaplasma capra]|nr:hypothetical protein [Anaplasma capra]MCU7611137.1 hypothetical protein [Anaplasma capra]MCU7612359.1 hypothetical protein [Anaplasma capra]